MPDAKSERLIATVETIYPSRDAFVARLAESRPLRIYFGIDPTNPVLHLGHTVPLRLLRRFQEAGHTVVLLIGDFTATVGDPSGRDHERSVLSRDDVRANVLAIKSQVFTVLSADSTELRYNSEWYDDASAMGSVRRLLELTHSFTAAQLWERDLFRVRQAKQQPVSLTEFLYPVLQAYDSVALDVDGEVGGTDQTFNMLAGRTLLRQQRGKEKFVITLPLIRGTDGRKMSKSYGNTIGVNDPPAEMYGKLMSIADDQILPYMTHLTDRFQTGAERDDFETLVKEKPRDAKATLAREVVTLYHGSEAATEAERAFDAQFRRHGTPSAVPHVKIPQPKDNADLIVLLGHASSRSDAIRLIEQGGVTVDGHVVRDPRAPAPQLSTSPIQVKVGKRRFSSASLRE